jgi:hypothetical protein
VTPHLSARAAGYLRFGRRPRCARHLIDGHARCPSGVIVTSRASSVGIDFVYVFRPGGGVDEDPVTIGALLPHAMEREARQNIYGSAGFQPAAALRVQLMATRALGTGSDRLEGRTRDGPRAAGAYA